MITEGFDRRTIANMEIALDRACKNLADGETHSARQLIAAKIVDCARDGETSLTALTRAAQSVATRLSKTTDSGEPSALTRGESWVS
jgi:hypothetical protein